jgi:hypothetical protein
MALWGCAQSRPPVDARSAPGGLDLRGTFTPRDLAYGGGPYTAARSEPRREIDLDPFLKPEALARTGKPHAPAAPRRPTPARAPAPQPALPPAPKVAFATATTGPAVQVEPVALAAVDPTPSSDLQRYADREQRSRELQNYKGGDAIVISTTALLVIILVVLLIVLLT